MESGNTQSKDLELLLVGVAEQSDDRGSDEGERDVIPQETISVIEEHGLKGKEIEKNVFRNSVEQATKENSIFPRGAWIDISIEELLDESSVLQYSKNLTKTKESSQIVRLVRVFDNGPGRTSYFVMERYGSSLSNLLETKTADQFWIRVHLFKAWSTCRMSPTFQRMLRKVLEGLIFLNEHQIPYELTLDRVVFLENDIGLRDPKLRHIYSFSGTFRPEDVFRDLKCMVEHIISMHGVNGISEEVSNFLELLTTKPIPVQNLVCHPVMWKPRKRLDYIVEARNHIRFSTLIFDKEAVQGFTDVVSDNWIAQVEQHPQLKRRLDYAQFNNKKPYSTSIYGLIKFIRDSFEHINDLFKVDEYVYYKWEDIELLFESLFPKLVTYLFYVLAYYVAGGVARNVAECSKLGAKPFMISIVGHNMAGGIGLVYIVSAFVGSLTAALFIKNNPPSI
ncbi:hypothetical protein IFM89_003236 [Coptis chinensis]|uniref:Uncharacterized protein n=1 Tax=Coptis chinensis TaxID=261450 RepID=A0A835H308_9MAGN|nr:hypothetical protein IFM89_003236 [Coptis chinensis]